MNGQVASTMLFKPVTINRCPAAETQSFVPTIVPSLENATLVLAFSGWMDGGEVSTGTVRRLVDLLGADQIADIDPEPYYIYNFPGSMEVAALFRPHIEIEEGLVRTGRHADQHLLLP